MKSKTAENKVAFDDIKSHSVEEILAAGGATAFGIKMSKDRDSLIKALEGTGAKEPITNEEWISLLSQLSKDK